MGKNKTTYTWIILVLSGIGLIFGTINLIFQLINIDKLLTSSAFSSPMINIINLIVKVVGLIFLGFFFFNLYNVTPKAINWTNKYFAFSLFALFLNVIFAIVLAGILGALLSSMMVIIALPILITIWITFVKHLEKAKKENLMDFS